MMCRQYDEIVQRDTNVDEFDGENGDKAFFEYLGNAYRVFLAGDDDQYNLLEQQEAAKHGACERVYLILLSC